MPRAVSTPANGLQPWRARWRDLGPLRWIAVASAVLPTAGLLVVVAHRRELAAAWPDGAGGVLLAAGAIGAASGAMLLPPGCCAFAAGYVLGAAAGAAAGALGSALGALAALAAWPLLGERLYAFMRPRPRAVAVRAFCGGPLPRAVLRVAVLRFAAKLPFAVTNLLLSVVRVPRAAVAAGSLLGALPGAWLAASAGAALRALDERRGSPGAAGVANLALAAATAVVTAVAARRAIARATGAR